MKRSARIEANKAHIKHTQKETESNVSGYWSEMIAMLASEQENMAYENNWMAKWATITEWPQCENTNGIKHAARDLKASQISFNKGTSPRNGQGGVGVLKSMFTLG